MKTYTPNYVAAKEQELAEQNPSYQTHQDIGMVILLVGIAVVIVALKLWDRFKSKPEEKPTPYPPYGAGFPFELVDGTEIVDGTGKTGRRYVGNGEWVDIELIDGEWVITKKK